jgi:hypothetical protein
VIADHLGTALCDGLMQNNKLRLLSFSAGYLSRCSDVTGVAFAKVIEQNSTLQSLRIKLNGNFMGTPTLSELSKSIAVNKTLRTLRIDDLSLGHKTFDDAQGVQLAQALTLNQGLRAVSIFFARLDRVTDRTGIAMAHVLMKNATIESLRMNFQGTTASDATVTALAEGLKVNTVLQSFGLNLKGVVIGDEAKMAMLQAISDNTTLMRLKLLVDCPELQAAADAAVRRNHEIHLHARSFMSGARNITIVGLRNSSNRLVHEFLTARSRTFLPQEYSHAASASSSGATALWNTAHSVATPVTVDEVHEECIDSHVQDEEDEQVQEAMQESLTEAFIRENEDIVQAILHSKVDAQSSRSPRELDVVVLHLTRCARSIEVTRAITESAELASARAAVHEAGLDLQPSWAGGAWVLLPLSPQKVGLPLSHHNILLDRRDEHLVREVLQRIERSKRPHIKQIECTNHDNDTGPEVASSVARSDLSDEDTCNASENSDLEVSFEIIVERTFIRGLLIHDAEVSEARHSAPAF